MCWTPGSRRALADGRPRLAGESADLKAFYPTGLLITDRQIIRLWVTRMIYSGIHFLGQIPFPDVSHSCHRA